MDDRTIKHNSDQIESHGSTSGDCPSRTELESLLDTTQAFDRTLADHIDECGLCQMTLQMLGDRELLSEYKRRRQNYEVASFLGPPLREGDLGSFNGIAIESKIGEGGMGMVFRGRDTQLGRKVAVKILKPLSNAKAVQRFERETKAAGRVNHDHIVPVHSAGHGRGGRPYMVMPLVKGGSLKDRVDKGPIPVRESAELIRQVADGLAAAHADDLIHRDVKPANILLDETDGRAKLADFGLVRVMDNENLTQSDMICGTPEFISPEQITHPDSIDHRCDIYSLGITLYQCLTASAPFRGRPMEVLAQHCSDDPKPPSRLNGLVSRDLETICLKAISKLPDNRYQSAGEMSADLGRWLDDKPILARPETKFERSVRFVKKHKGLVASAATIATLLIAGIASSSWFAVAANKARIESDENALLSETALEVLITSFDHSNPKLTGKKDMLAKDVLVLAKENVEETYSDEAREKYKLLDAISKSFSGLGDYQKALESAESALRAAEKLKGSHHEDTLQLKVNLADRLNATGKSERAFEILKKCVPDCQDKLGPDHRTTVFARASMVNALDDLGKTDEAIELGWELIPECEIVFGKDDVNSISMIEVVAEKLATKGGEDLKQAKTMIEDVIDRRVKTQGPLHPATIESRGDLANIQRRMGKIQDAIENYREVVAQCTELYGERHPTTIGFVGSMSYCLQDVREIEEALPLAQTAVVNAKEVLGEDHPATLGMMSTLATIHGKNRDLEKSRLIQEQVFELTRKKLGEKHPDTLLAMGNLIPVYFYAKEYDKALELGEQTLTLMKEVHGADHPLTLMMMNNVASVYDALGRVNEGLKLYEETYELMKGKNGPKHQDTLLAQHNLALTYRDIGDFDRAIETGEEVVRLRREVFGADNPDTLFSMNELAKIYRQNNQIRKSISLFEENIALKKNKLGPTHSGTTMSMGDLGIAYIKSGQFKKAIETFRATLAARTKEWGPKKGGTLHAQLQLSDSLAFDGQLQKALGESTKALEACETNLGLQNTFTIRAMRSVQRLRFRLADYEGAKSMGKNLVSVLEQHRPDNQVLLSDVHATMAEILQELENVVGAETACKSVLAFEDASKLSRTRANFVLAMTELKSAEVEVDTDQDDESNLADAGIEKPIKVFDEMVEQLPSMPHADRWLVLNAGKRILQAYQRQGDSEGIDRWQAKIERLESTVAELADCEKDSINE